VQRRKTGWWISGTWSKSARKKREGTGPSATIETACLAIARRLAIEIADRHTQSIEWHGIVPDDPLHGLCRNGFTRVRRRLSSTSQCSQGIRSIFNKNE
jgi:hypothetical protein